MGRTCSTVRSLEIYIGYLLYHRLFTLEYISIFRNVVVCGVCFKTVEKVFVLTTEGVGCKSRKREPRTGQRCRQENNIKININCLKPSSVYHQV
jgi:hypothetical protein